MLNLVFNKFAVVFFFAIVLFFSDGLYLGVKLGVLGCQLINLFLVFSLRHLNFLLLALDLINLVTYHLKHLVNLWQLLCIVFLLGTQRVDLGLDLFYFEDVWTRLLNLFDFGDEIFLLLWRDSRGFNAFVYDFHSLFQVLQSVVDRMT